MKKIVLFITLLSFLLTEEMNAQRFDIYEGDTINQVDNRNLKQGYWIFFNNDKSKIVQEGAYVNNKKEGIWKKYFPDGKIKSEITYQNNRTNGYAKIYNENGNISEEGIWKGNKWIGEYKFYHENGVPAYVWNYSENGKRSGEQKYYYDNGQLRIEGDWQDGKESGLIKEYFEDGSVKSEKNFADGKIDVNSIKEYQPRQKITKTEVVSANTEENTETTETTNIDTNNDKEKEYEVFTGNGFHKTYNKFKKLEREGNFVNGRQVDGKRYVYDENGVLLKTIILEHGKVQEVIRHSQEKNDNN